MKSTIIDASSLINLDNGGVLNALIEGGKFVFGPAVEAEVGDALADAALQAGAKLLDDSVIPASVARSIAMKFELGDGEMECLTFCEFDPELRMCSDDAAARRAANIRFGPGRVVGTIGLLREAVAAGILSCATAKTGYAKMLDAGAYIPRNLDSSIC